MPLATPSKIEALGFNAKQFGEPANWNDAGGYLALVLTTAELTVRDEVGDSTYDGAASGSVTEMRLMEAEAHFAAAELWRRLEVFNSSKLSVNRSSEGAPAIGSRFLANAEKMEAIALGYLQKITGNPSAGGISVGIVEKGPYTEVST